MVRFGWNFAHSLGKYLGWFCHFFKIFIFKGVVTSFRQNEAKTLGQPGDFKNGRILLKFGTLVPWVNIWGCFFHFLKIMIFGAWGRVFHQNEAGSLETVKMVGFGWNLVQLFLGWISRGIFFNFWKFWFLGPGDEFFTKTRLIVWGRLEISKMFCFTTGPLNNLKILKLSPVRLARLSMIKRGGCDGHCIAFFMM